MRPGQRCIFEEKEQRSLPVNKLIAFAAIAAFITMSAPTFAQSYDPSIGSGNIVAGPKGGMESGMSSRPLYDYAPSSGAHRYERHRMRRGD
jgi:hypothetical protein